MGQYWRILNLDRKERSQEMPLLFADSFLCTFPQMFGALCIVRVPQKRINRWLKTGSTALQPGPLGKLAPELLGLIFDELSEFREVAFLCITCKLMMNVGQRRLNRVTREFFGNWVGCRLICLGDWSKDKELPAGLLTDEEKHEIQTAELEDVEEDAEDRLSSYAPEYFKYVFGDLWNNVPRWEVIKGPEAITKRFLKSGMRRTLVWENPQICADIERYKELCHPELVGDRDSAVVLCNLTKAEYVRANGITVPSDSVGFLHALLSQICWSEIPEFAMDLDDETSQKLVHGPWAGDRFCITRLDELPELSKGLEEWLDVTEKVNAFLLSVWSQW